MGNLLGHPKRCNEVTPDKAKYPFKDFQRAIQCGGFWGFRFFWVTSKEVPRVDSRKSPVEVKKSKPSKIYLALEIKTSLWH